MSNGSGNELLNKVLKALVGHKVFATIGNTASRKVVRKILKIAKYTDCDDDEILRDVGRKVFICERCAKNADKLKKGLCLKCTE